MKVKLKDIKPNPYRYLNKGYPVDKEKVEKLRSSIKRTGFWDNLVARQKDGEIQIAYGHHRVEALRQDFPPDYEVNLIVKDLSDADMLKIMAAENDTVGLIAPSVALNTVIAALDFLKEDIEEFRKNAVKGGAKSTLSPARQAFMDRVKKKPGRPSTTTVLVAEFLDWPENRIDDVLAAIYAIDNKEMSIEEYKAMPSLRTVAQFRAAMKRFPLPKKEREYLVKRIQSEEFASRAVQAAALELRFKSKPRSIQTIEINDLANTITSKLLDCTVIATDSFIKDCDCLDEATFQKLSTAVGGFVSKLRRMKTVLGKNKPLLIEE